MPAGLFLFFNKMLKNIESLEIVRVAYYNQGAYKERERRAKP